MLEKQEMGRNNPKVHLREYREQKWCFAIKKYINFNLLQNKYLVTISY